MKTYERTCTTEYTIEFKSGGYGIQKTFKKGQKYLTSEVDENNDVMVFTNYWITIPAMYFDEGVQFTK